MDLLQLRYFQKIATLENISKAARELLVAQPSLSRSLKMMEEELGLPLFERNGRSIKLNQNGKILLKYSTKIFSLLDDAMAELSEHKQKADDTLRIYMLYSTKLLPELIVKFKRKYPHIKILLNRAFNEDVIPENFDVLIHASDEIAKQGNTCMLAKEECLLGMSKSHALNKYDEIPLEAIHHQDFLLLSNKNALGKVSHDFCRIADIEPNVILECDSQTTITSLVEHGLGLAFFPSLTWEVDPQKIILKKIKENKFERSIYLTCKPGYLSTSTQIFKKYVISFFTPNISSFSI